LVSDTSSGTISTCTPATTAEHKHSTISTLLQKPGHKQAHTTQFTVPTSESNLSELTNLSRQTCRKLLVEVDRESRIQLNCREIALLRAIDELRTDKFITDDTWAALSAHFTEKQRMDLVYTVGQYTQVSMILNTFGVPLDAGQVLDPDLKGF
jgi:alkylhydroperoxidase family enzyme